MPKLLIGMAAVGCLLTLTPPASAFQDSTDFNNSARMLAQDHQQLERVRIELLERGFNPGFDSELDEQAIAQLNEALRQFQSEYQLPVTGQIDASTVAALSIPNPSVDKTAPEVRRAKPSKKSGKK